MPRIHALSMHGVHALSACQAHPSVWPECVCAARAWPGAYHTRARRAQSDRAPHGVVAPDVRHVLATPPLGQTTPSRQSASLLEPRIKAAARHVVVLVLRVPEAEDGVPWGGSGLEAGGSRVRRGVRNSWIRAEIKEENSSQKQTCSTKRGQKCLRRIGGVCVPQIPLFQICLFVRSFRNVREKLSFRGRGGTGVS